MRHIDLSVLDDGDIVHDIAVSVVRKLETETAVDLLDDHVDARQQLADILHRPLLQRFRHDRMVGVCDGVLRDIPGLIPVIAEIIEQHAHQLWNAQHRMGVVELDGDLLMQVVQVRIAAQMPPDDLIDAGAHEEVFLLQAQLLAMLSGIIRIDVAGDLLDLVDIVAQICRFHEVLSDLRIPQAQRVGHLGVVADDRHIIRHRAHHEGRDMVDHGLAVLIEPHVHMAAELHVAGMLDLAHFPDVAILQPYIRHFHLLIVLDLLFEQTVLIADAVAMSRKVQRSQGIQEAGGQAAQSAVAQTCVCLQLLDVVDVDAKVRKAFLDDVVDPQVHEIIGEETPDQKFHGKIIHLLLLIPLDGIFRVFPVDTGIVADHFPQNNVFLSNVCFFN